ncbi:MAG: hypothetical protein IJ416_05440 [Ruminiclostridium sp.]|nr:hypothetical protein [Ruminiclostridium sp.]MBQ8825782.1 hypothetical protein [Oscillospiraceae bacterium]
MKKYIIPTINCVIICALILFLNIRDDTPIIGILFSIGTVAVTLYLIKLIRNNGNEIKINAINKLMTLTSVVLTAGCLYELITGNMISDKTGDIIALIVVIIGICIWLYDYCIKPFKNKK